MKQTVKGVVKSYTDSVKDCIDEIYRVNEIHNSQSEESKVFETKKVITRWFRYGGKI